MLNVAGEKKKRIFYLDFLKTISVFFMILLHSASYYFNQTPINSRSWVISVIYDGLSRFCVPIFVMISGALLLGEKKDYSITYLFKHRIFRLAVAYVFWSLIYAVIDNLGRYERLNLEVLVHIVGETLVGQWHMWFIWMIVGLYAIVPFLKMICQNAVMIKYYLVLSFLFTQGISGLLLIPCATAFIKAIISNISMTFVVGYSGYFVLGYYLHTYSIKHRKLIYAVGFISTGLTIILTCLCSGVSKQANERFFQYLMPNVYFSSVALFMFAKNNAYRIEQMKISRSVCMTVSSTSLGIYLSHILFMRMIENTDILKKCSSGIMIPLYAVGVMICSYIFVWLIKQIPLLKQYVI